MFLSIITQTDWCFTFFTLTLSFASVSMMVAYNIIKVYLCCRTHFIIKRSGVTSITVIPLGATWAKFPDILKHSFTRLEICTFRLKILIGICITHFTHHIKRSPVWLSMCLWILSYSGLHSSVKRSFASVDAHVLLSIINLVEYRITHFAHEWLFTRVGEHVPL